MKGRLGERETFLSITNSFPKRLSQMRMEAIALGLPNGYRGPSSAAFPGTVVGAESEVKQLGLELTAIWVGGTAG